MDKLFTARRIIGWLCLLMMIAGCTKSPNSTTPIWKKQSLIAGPEALVRINRQRQFNRVIFDCPDNQIQLRDEQDQLIELPEKFKRIYIKKVKQKLKLAFKPGKAALAAGQSYREITIKSHDDSIQHYQLIIPQIGLKRIYEARAFHLSIKYQRLAVINQLPMEMYIARVIPAEMDPDHFTLEALKAQAVVARTWALRNRRRHLRFGYHYCDGPHCQVYRGRKLVSDRAEQATKITAGEVIAIKDKVVDAFYHSTCGGNTAFVHEVWKGRPQAHLNRVEDSWKASHRAYCARSPYYNWSATMSLRHLEKLLKKKDQLTSTSILQDAKVNFVNRSGRVLKVQLKTDTQEKIISGHLFRKIINQSYGKRKILSNLYQVKVEGKKVRILGHGLGHGVGLCQWGARGLAQHGFGYQEILQHYFKTTSMKRLYGLVKEASLALTKNSKTDK